MSELTRTPRCLQCVTVGAVYINRIDIGAENFLVPKLTRSKATVFSNLYGEILTARDYWLHGNRS